MDTIKEFFTNLFQPPYTGLLIFAAILFLLGIIGRVSSGAKKLTAGLESAIAVVFIYVVGVAAAGADAQTKIFLGALPFLSEMSDGIGIYNMMHNNLSAFLLEVANVFYLALTVSLLQVICDKIGDLFGNKANVIVWYFLQCCRIVLAMAINYGIRCLIAKYVPEEVLPWISYAIVILMVLAMIGVFLNIINIFKIGIMAALTSFLFDNTFGRMLTGAFLSTAFICIIFVVFDMLGWLALLMPGAILLTSFVPVLILLLLVWYIVWLLI